MKKIASPQELVSELQDLLRYASTGLPERAVLAARLGELSNRVMPIKVADMSSKDLYASLWDLNLLHKPRVLDDGTWGHLEYYLDARKDSDRFMRGAADTIKAWFKKDGAKLWAALQKKAQENDDFHKDPDFQSRLADSQEVASSIAQNASNLGKLPKVLKALSPVLLSGVGKLSSSGKAKDHTDWFIAGFSSLWKALLANFKEQQDLASNLGTAY